MGCRGAEEASPGYRWGWGYGWRGIHSSGTPRPSLVPWFPPCDAEDGFPHRSALIRRRGQRRHPLAHPCPSHPSASARPAAEIPQTLELPLSGIKPCVRMSSPMWCVGCGGHGGCSPPIAPRWLHGVHPGCSPCPSGAPRPHVPGDPLCGLVPAAQGGIAAGIFSPQTPVSGALPPPRNLQPLSGAEEQCPPPPSPPAVPYAVAAAPSPGCTEQTAPG